MRVAREDVFDAGIDGPVPLVWRRAFGMDRSGRRQFERREDGIEDMAAHVSERAGAEIKTLAPVCGMIIGVANKRALGADTEPEVPIEIRRNRVVSVWARRGIAPGLGAPGMDFLDFPDGA